MSNSRATKHLSTLHIPLTTLAALATLLVCSTVSATPVNLVTNGSFEQNAFFVERSDFPRVADLSGSAPTGWTRDSSTLAEYMTRSPAYLGLTIYNPADGDYFIGAHDGEWWEQTFATTADTEYTMTYSSAYGAGWWSTASSYYRPGVAPGQVTLTGNTLLLATDLTGTSPAPTGTTLLDAPFIWSQHTATFVADSDFTTLRFAGSDVVANGGFVFIDNVLVTAAAVPEPQAIWLLVLGLPGIWLTSRRRKHVKGVGLVITHPV